MLAYPVPSPRTRRIPFLLLYIINTKTSHIIYRLEGILLPDKSPGDNIA